MRAPASYAEPFAWWGPVWTPSSTRTAADLVRDGTLSAEIGGLLWALLARRASVVVAAERAGAGKTTLLGALLDFYPGHSRRLYLRGCYEPFAFLDDPGIDPAAALLLVNEISGHLPVYLWGAGVRRALDAVGRGFALAATAHAASATDLVGLLAGYPLRVPLATVAACQVVVVLDAWREGGEVRRQVAAVTALLPPVGAGGLTLAPLAERAGRNGAVAVDARAAAALAARLGDPAGERLIRREIEHRAARLGTPPASSPPPAATGRSEHRVARAAIPDADSG